MAKEVSGFFDSTLDDERFLGADEFARRWRQVFTDGVRSGGVKLKVTADGTSLTLKVGYGTGLVQGYDYWLQDDSTGPMELTIDTPDAQPRVDRVVLRLDTSLAERRIYLAIKKGTPGPNPVAPALTRDTNVYELSLARINVAAGVVTIKQEHITDERSDPELCGIMNVLQIDYASLEAAMQGEFEEWMETIEDILDENAAGNLLNLITDLQNRIHLSTTDPDGSLMADGDIWIKHE